MMTRFNRRTLVCANLLVALGVAAHDGIDYPSPVAAIQAARVAPGFSFTVTFVAADALDLSTIFPDWPRNDTLAGLADLQTVLAVQASRTANDATAARHDVGLAPMSWASEILGSQFNALRFPVTAALVERIRADFAPYAHRSPYPVRLRPQARDSRVAAVIAHHPNSYPSAHAALSWIFAEVLSDAMLAKRELLNGHAERSGWLQVVAGAHYPTDSSAGQMLGQAFVVALRASPEYRTALEQSRKELLSTR